MADLIRGKRSPVQFATATLATLATVPPDRGLSVAPVATVAVAKPIAPEVASPAIDVYAVVAAACLDVAGLSADQYLALLSADDITGIQDGETGLAVLRAYAPHFAEGLRSGRLTVPEPARPVHVRCGQCAHFVRDPVNPLGGIGTCAISGEGAAGFVMYPNRQRVCGDFVPIETSRHNA